MRSGRRVIERGITRAHRQILDEAARGARSDSRDAVHALVVLDAIPDRATRKQLNQDGVELLEYIPDRAWIARLPADQPARILSNPAVRSIQPLQASDRLAPALRRDEWRAWATDQLTGEAVITVQFMPSVSRTDAETIVRDYGGVVIDYVVSTRTVVTRMHIELVEYLADDDRVLWIEQPLPPLKPVNAENRRIVGADTLRQLPYDLDGSGVDMLIYDSGRVYSHDDLGDRLEYGDTASFSEHSTHVACTACGDGSVNSTNSGMAPLARVLSIGFEVTNDSYGVFLYTNPGDIERDLSYAKNTWPFSADLLNASIGANVAWNNYPCTYEGNYGVTAQLLDAIARGSLGEPFIMAWAAGNERGGACGSGYGTVAPPAGAKNVIQSGATDDDDEISSFSSWGPTDDGRLKPVISAPGVNVKSCNRNNSYTTMSGTSMASPTTAGIIALMLQQYRATFSTNGEPRPSTVRALLINTAVDLGRAGPDYQYGYGRIDGVRLIQAVQKGAFREERLHDHAEVHEYNLPLSGTHTSPLSVSLAWDDPPASMAAARKLVNDLDLEVESPGGTIYKPWILDPQIPTNSAIRGRDELNNQEQVTVTNPPPGSWTIRVRAHSLPMTNQTYSIAFPGAYTTAPAVSAGGPFPNVPEGVPFDGIQNGSFEEGTSPWTWFGSAQRTAKDPQGGSWAAMIGGTIDGAIAQDITIPEGVTHPTLTYGLRMSTDETTHWWDFFDVELYTTNGDPITTIASFSDAAGNLQGQWVTMKHDLGPQYTGRTVRLQFQADVDTIINTHFLVDNVRIQDGRRLNLTPWDVSQQAGSNETVTYQFEVENLTASNQQVNLDYSGNAWLSTGPDTLSLPNGVSTQFTIKVTVPAGVAWGDADTTAVRAVTSDGLYTGTARVITRAWWQLPPSVTTIPPASLTWDSATLTALVNPMGTTTIARFEYGTDTTYGATSPLRYPGDDPIFKEIKYLLLDLPENQTYHYRIVASNVAGTVASENRAFTLPAQPGDLSWHQAPNCGARTLYASQNETNYPFDVRTADDFVCSASNRVLSAIRWWAGEFNGAPPYVSPEGWELHLYSDGGSCRPNTLLHSWYAPADEVNEEAYCTDLRRYTWTLASPYPLLPDQHYWLAIQARLLFPPQAGWADASTSGTECDGVTIFPLIGMDDWESHADDHAFTLYTHVVARQDVASRAMLQRVELLFASNMLSVDVEFCHTNETRGALAGPFWYVPDPAPGLVLLESDGTLESGAAYKDVTKQIEAELMAQGGNRLFEAGECVTVTNLRFGSIKPLPLNAALHARTVSNTILRIDSDGDGAPDAWEKRYGFSPIYDGDGANDPDGDRVSNGAEGHADTDPFDASSYLRMGPVLRTQGQVRVQWAGGTSAVQILESAPHPDGPWTRIFTNQPMTAVTNTYEIVQPSATGLFFRIDIP
jgi:subtilisin family serine protease